MAGALIGALRVSLSAETSAFEAGMKRSQRTAAKTASSIEGSLKGVGNSLKAGIAGFVSSVSVGAILAAGKVALDYAGSLGEVAQQLGVTTRELQTFRFAAQQMGASQEEADQALGKLSVSMSKALSGSKQAAAAFKAVGVSLVDLQTKSKVEIIGQIADEMNRTGGASKNAAAGVAIFGRGFQKIGALMASGSRGMNQLAMAAEELGIVLSDEQIQKADETADKLDAMQTVLKARIAGVVADNADSILRFADSLSELARFIGTVVGALARLNQAIANIPQPPAWLQGFIGGPATMGIEFLKNITNAATKPKLGRSATIKLGAAKPFAPAVSGSPKQFLAGGGGGRKGGGGRDRSADEALRKQLDTLRDQNQFDQDILRAKQDVLQAQQSLARNEDDRANIGYELLALDRRQYEGQLAYEVQINALTKGAEGITQAQADQLLEHYNITESLKREAIQREQDAANREHVARLVDVDFDLQREKLELEAGLAETASEQRDVQLRLLDLWYRQERAKLDAIMAEEEIGSLAWEEARRRKAALDANQGARKANVEAGTRGPLEDYMSQLPTTTEKWNESLEMVAANGLKAVEDGIVDILTGAKSVGDALQDILAGIIEQLIRIGVQKLIGMAIGGGFAEGGYTGTGGKYEPAGVVHRGEYVFDAGSTKQLGVPFLEALRQGKMPGMAMGGLAGLSVPRVSYSERVSVNDNTERVRAGDTYNLGGFSFPGVTNPREARQSALQAATVFRQAVGRSSRVNG